MAAHCTDQEAGDRGTLELTPTWRSVCWCIGQALAPVPSTCQNRFLSPNASFVPPPVNQFCREGEALGSSGPSWLSPAWVQLQHRPGHAGQPPAEAQACRDWTGCESWALLCRQPLLLFVGIFSQHGEGQQT